jgi:hypothetical protein
MQRSDLKLIGRIIGKSGQARGTVVAFFVSCGNDFYILNIAEL